MASWKLTGQTLHRKGKIGQAILGIIDVILLITSQYPLSQIFQMKWPVVRDVVAYRHTDLPCKFESFVSSSPHNAFNCNFNNNI